jgi:hypothetical protein
MTVRTRNLLVALVVVAVAVLLFDLGGIRTDMVNGARDGWHDAGS